MTSFSKRAALQSALVALAFAALLGCGGKVVFEDPGAGGGTSSATTTHTASTTVAGTTIAASSSSGGLDCAMVSFDFDAPIGQCTTDTTCDISGTLPNGHALREHCDSSTPSCVLFVDGKQVCKCPPNRLNFANACSNGAPTCDGWVVDYSDIQFCNAP